MNHADVKKHLADYLEGDLELEDRALVDAHLDACTQCSTEVEEMLQTIRLLRSLPEPEIPPMIAANVMRRIRAGEAEPGFWGRLSRMVSSLLEPTFVLPASAIAVAALVFSVIQGQGIGFGIDPNGLIGRSPNSEGTVNGAPRIAALASPLSSSSSSTTRSGDRLVTARGLDRGVPRRIRIRIDGSGVSRLSMSRGVRPSTSPRPFAPNAPIPSALGSTALLASAEAMNSLPSNIRRQRVSTSVLPEAFAARFSQVMYGRNMIHPAEAAHPVVGTLVASQQSGRGPGVSNGLMRSVAQSQTVSQDRILRDLVSGGGDPRDAWLALGFEDPLEFANYIGDQNLAEQELWVARLSERAEARGVLDDFLNALRESRDATALWVADDFAAHAAQAASDPIGESAEPALAPPLR